jgi:hypothetical protein
MASPNPTNRGASSFALITTNLAQLPKIAYVVMFINSSKLLIDTGSERLGYQSAKHLQMEDGS